MIVIEECKFEVFTGKRADRKLSFEEALIGLGRTQEPVSWLGSILYSFYDKKLYGYIFNGSYSPENKNLNVEYNPRRNLIALFQKVLDLTEDKLKQVEKGELNIAMMEKVSEDVQKLPIVWQKMVFMNQRFPSTQEGDKNGFKKMGGQMEEISKQALLLFHQEPELQKSRKKPRKQKLAVLTV